MVDTVTTRNDDSVSSSGRDLLFWAATKCFYAHGYHGTSVRDITESIGFSPGAMYHHYKSKQDLLFAIVSWFLQESIENTRKAIESAGPDPADRLFHAARSHVLWNASDVMCSFVVNSEIRSLTPENRARNVAQRDTLQRMFDSAVVDGTKNGLFTTPYPLETSRAIVTMCTAVATWYRSSGPLTPSQIADQYGEMSLNLAGFREGYSDQKS
ncbi:TetR/AcrR family transcriptional regulator [Rhodococcus wratislaviensis]|nr:TetR/AcrR family transcriptional regulator [Rhodococcus wratislaviensis]